MNGQPTLACGDDRRREKVRTAELNGLDYLEVRDDGRTLRVYFLGKAPPEIQKENVRIEGGRRVRGIEVRRIEVERREEPDLDDHMDVVVDREGDFSPYELQVVELEDGRPTERPMTRFDPRYARVEFSFKAGSPSSLDCKVQEVCPPRQYTEPEIDYLAKDYASFRQLILDRLALIMPDWRERHVPDVGIALVELLAYVGDHLSYYQDAVATEAYLGTARQRVSVGRHARLVDYRLHEGCNARAWVCVETDQRLLALNADDLAFLAVNEDVGGATRYSPWRTLGRSPPASTSGSSHCSRSASRYARETSWIPPNSSAGCAIRPRRTCSRVTWRASSPRRYGVVCRENLLKRSRTSRFRRTSSRS